MSKFPVARQKEMVAVSGYKSPPQLHINQRYYGDMDELQTFEDQSTPGDVLYPVAATTTAVWQGEWGEDVGTWEEVTDARGTCFYNATTGESLWELPGHLLPEGCKNPVVEAGAEAASEDAVGEAACKGSVMSMLEQIQAGKELKKAAAAADDSTGTSDGTADAPVAAAEPPAAPGSASGSMSMSE
jgi:hypothetical protein